MKKNNLVYIVSDIDKAIAFEWIVENLNLDKVNLHFILINSENGFLHQYLVKNNIPTRCVSVYGKSHYLTRPFLVRKILKKWSADTVHCHLRVANFIGLFGARLANVPKRIYTRHHSTYHHEFYPGAVRYDRWFNKLSTQIVAISKNVENILQTREGVSKNKIRLIHHGFDLDKFGTLSSDRVNQLRKKYNLNKDDYVIGVIARYIDWKGHTFIIEACKKLIQSFSNVHFVFANSYGPDYDKIHSNLIKSLPNDSFTEIRFENDLFGLYQLFDVYVHTPVNNEIEAFGQTYVECLASGIPMVCTLSGVGSEIVKDKYNALVVPYKSSNEIFNSILELKSNSNLVQELVKNGKKSVNDFGLNSFIEKLNLLYSE